MSKQHKAEWATPEFIDERTVDVSTIGKTIKSRGIKCESYGDTRKLRPSRKSLAPWNPSKNRTERELQQLRDNVWTANGLEERGIALCRLNLAYIDEDGLTAIRQDHRIDREFRAMASDEYEFRVKRASLELAQERNPNLSIKPASCNATKAGAFEAAARLVFEYIRESNQKSPEGFYQWCRRFADSGVLHLPSCTVVFDKDHERRQLTKIELEVTLENKLGEVLDDGIVVEGLGKLGDETSFYSKRTLKDTYQRYKNSKIF